MENWLSLKEASEMSGKSIPALRQAIKRGKLAGKKISSPMGDKWLLDPSSIGLNKLNTKTEYFKHEHAQDTTVNTPNTLNNFEVIKDTESLRTDRTVMLYERLLEEKDRLEEERGKHIDTLNILLRDFQKRIYNLEEDKREIESQLKLLPAPPLEVSKQLKDAATEVEKSKKQLKEALDEKQSLQNQSDTLAQKMEQLKKASHLILEENKTLKARIENFEQEILKYKVAENRLKKLEEDLLNLNNSREELTKENQSLTIELNQVKIARNEYKNQVDIRERDNRELIAERDKIQKAAADIWNERENLERQLEIEKRKPWWKKLI